MMLSAYENTGKRISLKQLSGKKRIISKDWTIRHIGAAIGLLGGLLTLFGAIFLSIFEYPNAGEKSDLANRLFITVLPLWFFGAHCFDKAEDSKKIERRKEYLENPL